MHSHAFRPLAWLLLFISSGCGGFHEAISANDAYSPGLAEAAADESRTATPNRITDGMAPVRRQEESFRDAPTALESLADSATDVSLEIRSAGWPDESPVRLPSVTSVELTAGTVDLAAFSPKDDLAIDSVIRLPATDTSAADITYVDLFQNQWDGIVSDHRQFYSLPTVAWLAAGFGVGAAMANTSFDEHFIHDTYVENVILAPSHEYAERFHQAKFFGDGYYTIPLFAALALGEPLIDRVPYGSTGAEWGQRSLRTILVGGPPMLALQYLVGGSRPGESAELSEWRPFADNNGVSGHAFMGAIPFLSAAKMTDNLWAKGGLYAASMLPALSRVNDDDHYLSQAFLGWWISYLAASAVDRSYDPDPTLRWFLFSNQQAQGVAVELRR